MRLPVKPVAALALIAILAACGGGGSLDSAAVVPTTGPGADYPMVLGAPFTVDGVTYTPVDRLNYDAVGYAALGVAPLAAISDETLASLFEPDGPGTSAYLLTGNYRVILQYNCSNYYALSVGLLADEIVR